jgi:omega-6 fatty acid desaturase (delta-12 desaturase)
MRDYADPTPVPTTAAKPAGEAARRWRASLPDELRQRSLVRGGVLLSVAAVGYVLSIVGAVWLPSLFGRAVSLSLAPMMIGALFIIGHDAAHNSFTPYSWLNRLLGRLVLLPAWHPYTSWAYAHNTLHHGGTNLRGKHPDFTPLTKEEYDRLPRWRRLLEKFYRSPFGPGTSYLIGFYFGYILFPRQERRPPLRRQFECDRLLVFGFFALQILGMYLLARQTTGLFLPPLAAAFVDVILPWMVWIQFMGFVSFIQHTHPRLAWYDNPKEWSFYHVQLKKLDACGFSVPHRKAPKQHHGPRCSSYRPSDSALSSAQKPALAGAKLRGTCGGHPLVSLAILGIVPRL